MITQKNYTVFKVFNQWTKFLNTNQHVGFLSGENVTELIASLMTIMSVEEGLKSQVADCIRVRAMCEKRELKDDDIVAIFNVHGTTSYQVFFIDKDTTIEDIKNELNKLGTRLNYDSEEVLKKYIEKM
jgi:hypothetical protein